MTRGTTRRGGFTLLELLVVLALIVLLMAITVSAVFRVQSQSREKNTNTHLQKIHMAVTQQWNAAVNRIKQEDPPQIVKEATKNADGTYDPARAKALHLKLRLRQEFPENFGDLFNGNITLPQFNGAPAYKYTPKATFVNAIGTPWVNNGAFPEYAPESQSSALLVMILSQGQGGVATDPETIAKTKLFDFPQQQVDPVTQQHKTIQLRCFVDEWDNPIAFFRFADDDMTDVLGDLNLPPYVTAAQVQSGNLDPQDPDGRLKMDKSKWITINGQSAKDICASFLTYPTQGGRPYIKNPFDGLNRGPFVGSAGKNGKFRVTLNGPMETDLDNLYSYRIAQSGRGN